jgi:hypothetical protein
MFCNQLQVIKSVTPIVTNRTDCNSNGKLGSEQDRAPAIKGELKNLGFFGLRMPFFTVGKMDLRKKETWCGFS